MSGDSCEKHGWWEVNGQDACPSCELTLLRAEVERLTNHVEGVNEELDELHYIDSICYLNGIKVSVSKLLEEAGKTQEALAQVVILAQEAQKVVDNHEEGFSCQDGVAQNLPKLLKNLPVEARALLDRLQQLQHIVDSLSPLQDRLRNHPLRGENGSLAETAIKVLDWLHRAEAVVEAAQQINLWAHEHNIPRTGMPFGTLQKALAAWEEGKT